MSPQCLALLTLEWKLLQIELQAYGAPCSGGTNSEPPPKEGKATMNPEFTTVKCIGCQLATDLVAAQENLHGFDGMCGIEASPQSLHYDLCCARGLSKISN